MSVPFSRWLSNRLGTTRWVVAARLTPKLKAKGYEIAVGAVGFRALLAEYESGS